MHNVKTKYFEYGNKEMEYLINADKILGNAILRLGKINREVIPDLFAALIHATVGQQISAKATKTIWNRMQENFEEITPKIVSRQTVEAIQKCGLSKRKAGYIKNIAQTVDKGELDLESLYFLSDADVIKKLLSLKGIGTWTAEMLLLNSMERQDVVSFGDIAIKRGMMKLYGHNEVDKNQFDIYKNRYSPFGSVASIYLWKLSFDMD